MCLPAAPLPSSSLVSSSLLSSPLLSFHCVNSYCITVASSLASLKTLSCRGAHILPVFVCSQVSTAQTLKNESSDITLVERETNVGTHLQKQAASVILIDYNFIPLCQRQIWQHSKFLIIIRECEDILFQISLFLRTS